jgi:hypothetical protein
LYLNSKRGQNQVVSNILSAFRRYKETIEKNRNTSRKG